MNGASQTRNYEGTIGFTYIATFIFGFQVALLTLLLAMFIN